MRVVDRQQPAHRFAFAGTRRHGIGDQPRIGQHAFDDAQESLAVIGRAARDRLDAVRRQFPGDLRHPAHQIVELRAAVRAVQDRHVIVVRHVVEMMCPATGNDDRAAGNEVRGFDDLVGVELVEHIPARQHRLFLGRAKIGEDQPIAFFDRIPGLAHMVAMLAELGLARLFEAMAFSVEEPAVIATADAAILDLAVIKRRAAMGAARIEQAGLATAVAEEDQILAQHADLLRPVGGFARQRDRVPIAAQQLAHLGAGTGLGVIAIGRSWLAAISRAFINARAKRHGQLSLARYTRLFRHSVTASNIG